MNRVVFDADEFIPLISDNPKAAAFAIANPNLKYNKVINGACFVIKIK
jgi:hypothetical protein